MIFYDARTESKKRREELKMTQVELSKKTELSQGYISMLEHERFNPTAPVVIKLASALKLSTDYLLIEKEERRAV